MNHHQMLEAKIQEQRGRGNVLRFPGPLGTSSKSWKKGRSSSLPFWSLAPISMSLGQAGGRKGGGLGQRCHLSAKTCLT